MEETEVQQPCQHYSTYILPRQTQHHLQQSNPINTPIHPNSIPPSPNPLLPSNLVVVVVTMALDSFFHNKIESMKLEIIQGQAVLRRLEAQRNDYNSRGILTTPSRFM